MINIVVCFPEYPSIRVFIYRGYRLINEYAPRNGITRIVIAV